MDSGRRLRRRGLVPHFAEQPGGGFHETHGQGGSRAFAQSHPKIQQGFDAQAFQNPAVFALP
jgi:hypothetical protein